MSRVEPKDQPQPAERRVDDDRRQPSQAEGDERTVEEALRREEQKRPED